MCCFSLHESESEMTLTGFIRRGGRLCPLPLSLYPENGNVVYVMLPSSVWSAEKFPLPALFYFDAIHVGLVFEKAAVGHFQFAGGVDGCNFKALSIAPHERSFTRG